MAALEAKSTAGAMSALVRRWLGHPLTPAEQAQADREAAQPAAELDLNSMSKEAREWLQA
jgi:hypothetical protein